MDHKTFSQALANRNETDVQSTEKAIEALGNIIGKTCRDNNAIAIPSFGTFSAELHQEEIRIDHSSGKRILCPPELNLKFTPAPSLLKSLEL